jgi:tetratricopeptide (TPR) repeat protein
MGGICAKDTHLNLLRQWAESMPGHRFRDVALEPGAAALLPFLLSREAAMRIVPLLLVVCLPVTATAQEKAAQHAAHKHEVLGTVNFRNSGNPAAQAEFQRGVALLHSFEYQDAAAAFERVQRADPALAVAYWLHALTYSRVVWGYENLEQSRAVLARLAPTQEARLAKARTAYERAFGAAVEAFYQDAPLRTRAQAFADALLTMVRAYPDDQEANTFAALGNMLAWFETPAAERARYNDAVREHALRAFRANPQHPGAAHYLIHFVDMNPAQAQHALEFARAYDKIAPDAEHALHMPSHVYLPLGMWADVVAANERAWAASRREVSARQGRATENSWHALDWLQYSYLQLGRNREARALVDTAHNILRNVTFEPNEPDARNAANLAAFRYGWETGDWSAYPNGIPAIDGVLSQPRPSARATGMATTAAYQSAVAALRARNDKVPAMKVLAAFRAQADALPPQETRRAALNRLATQLEAMSAWSDGERERAIIMLQALAPTEPNNASLPPTIIPSYELLGEYLLELGRKEEAAAAFTKVLELRPHRAAAVRGLERTR